MEEGEELETVYDTALEDILDAVKGSLATGVNEEHDCEDEVIEMLPPKSILKSSSRQTKKKKSKSKASTTKVLHWADDVDVPLVVEHEIPQWDRRPNLRMFRFDLLRPPPPQGDMACLGLDEQQKPLVIFGLVCFVLLGSIALVLLFKMLGML
eukprot:TRINITY_DN2905_c0_g1_i1.p1 TRINITY_DN2905_c0_g1~~TRINITY_DN2905_c0_g1_i1.p1  ORF type:complete len:153 (-),score=18.40 TRINITY_DN2905_c0_g1_i1:205-663(-)